METDNFSSYEPIEEVTPEEVKLYQNDLKGQFELLTTHLGRADSIIRRYVARKLTHLVNETERLVDHSPNETTGDFPGRRK